MQPSIWGPHAWFFLHSITMAYPDDPNHEDRKRMRRFLKSLQYLLPCPTCSKNFQEHIRKNSFKPALRSRKRLIKWLIDIHNAVNQMKGKRTLSYDEAFAEMNKHYKE